MEQFILENDLLTVTFESFLDSTVIGDILSLSDNSI